MPSFLNSNIVSHTKFIRMIAVKSEMSQLADYKQEKEWNLHIYISGQNMEYPASDGQNLCHYTKDEAWSRVVEFEQAVSWENKAFIQETLSNALNFINNTTSSIFEKEDSGAKS